MFDLRNKIDFYLRNKIHLSRKNYSEPNESKDDLCFNEKEILLEKDLLKKYNFEPYRNNSTEINYCQNLYTLNFLDKYLPIEKQEKLSVLDIGSKNWFYVAGEYYFFKKYCLNLNLDGVELDAYRLYSNFYNRYEVAKYYIKNLDGTNYIPDDVMNITNSYDYIIWILPFVTLYPLKCWGLPKKYFNPHKLFEHAYSLLKPNGKMLIVNQGEQEYDIQQKIAMGKILYSTKLENTFYEYENERFISIIGKTQ